MRVIADVEANGLNPDKIWCVAALDIDTGEEFIFDRVWENPVGLRKFAAGVTQWVGHNFLGYDIKVLRELLGLVIAPFDVVDTLVVSRLVNFARPGGHGLESWGVELGVPKPAIDRWDIYSPEMVNRCQQDVRINKLLYDRFHPYIDSSKWQLAMKIEHSAADFCRRLGENGFPFDIAAARELSDQWTSERDLLSAAMLRDFEPRSVEVGRFTPKLTKSGRLHMGDFRWYDGDPNLDPNFVIGVEFVRYADVPFNPASKNDVIDRLWEHGWKPVTKTDGYKDYLRRPKRERDPDRLLRYERYGWKLDEVNLKSVPEMAPRSILGLVRWLELTGLLNQLNGWIELYDPSDHRIHGRFHSIGAWSHRCSHSNPNMANASSLPEIRALWTADSDTVLVGTDASGIQLRVLAHYMGDPRFIQAVQGDPHTLNAEALGNVALKWEGHPDPKKAPRQRAKKFIYSWLLGAANGKLAEDLECTVREAAAGVDNFIRFYPGLESLKRYDIPRDAQRGYFEGLDGRYVRQDQERLIISGYLQNGEAVIMKLARMLWEDRLRKLNVWYEPVNFVHDEWQTLSTKRRAKLVGLVQRWSIRKAGKILKTRCPMDGETKIGMDWHETH